MNFLSPVPQVVHDVVTVPNSELKVGTNGKKTYDLKGHGVKLELPQKTSASFNLKILSSHNSVLPGEIEQLSPWYEMETKGDLGGPVGVELQHCALVKEDGQQLGMKFAVVKVKDGEASGKPVLLEGRFNSSSYGRVEIGFPNWQAAVVRDKTASGPSPVFLANLYYQPLSPTKCLIHFIIVPNQEAWEKVQLYS